MRTASSRTWTGMAAMPSWTSAGAMSAMPIRAFALVLRRDFSFVYLLHGYYNRSRHRADSGLPKHRNCLSVSGGHARYKAGPKHSSHRVGITQALLQKGAPVIWMETDSTRALVMRTATSRT